MLQISNRSNFIFKKDPTKAIRHQMVMTMEVVLVLLGASIFACLPVADSFVQNPSLTSGISIFQPQETRSSPSRLFLFDFLKPKEEEEDEERPALVEEYPAQDFSDDPVDKIFGFFFGAKEESPMGMKRFGRERFPEQYPAVLDEWAEPVEGDDKGVAALRPLLKNTNLEFRNLKVRWCARWSGRSECEATNFQILEWASLVAGKYNS